MNVTSNTNLYHYFNSRPQNLLQEKSSITNHSRSESIHSGFSTHDSNNDENNTIHSLSEKEELNNPILNSNAYLSTEERIAKYLEIKMANKIFDYYYPKTTNDFETITSSNAANNSSSANNTGKLIPEIEHDFKSMDDAEIKKHVSFAYLSNVCIINNVYESGSRYNDSENENSVSENESGSGSGYNDSDSENSVSGSVSSVNRNNESGSSISGSENSRGGVNINS